MSVAGTIPRHVGIIMDGNRRWARERDLPLWRGHGKGQEVLRRIAHEAFESGVEYLTVYAFSTENWKRSEQEVGYLMRRVGLAIKKYIQEFVDGGVRVVFLGSRESLSGAVLKAIELAEMKTAQNTKATLSVCFNYGGQRELADAMKLLLADGVSAEDVTPELVSQYVYHPEIPPLDLLIRTGGEQRLSNFMLWRAAYAEFYFTETLWPDFGAGDLHEALDEYAARQRRFGS